MMDSGSRAGWNSLRGLILIFLSVFFLVPNVHGSPTPSLSGRGNEIDHHDARSLAKRYSGSPSGRQGTADGTDTSDYPSDSDIRSAFTNPSGPFVFFSNAGADGSTLAYNFAKEKNGVIFRGAYPAKYTIRNKRSKSWYQDFADRFSGVFAEKASGEVFLVSNWPDANVRDCSVWSRIEFDTLKDNSNVNKITLVDATNFQNTKTYWERSSGGSPFDTRSPENKERSMGLEDGNSLEKRASYCFDWNGDGDDPSDPDSSVDADATTYASGWCGVHIVQYQKNEGPGGNTADYRFDVTLYDANQEEIGSVELLDIPSGQTRGVDSALPYVFDITAGNVDSDAVLMAYADQSFGSNDQQHHCNFGKYDSGSRNGDCGFTC